MSSRNKQLILIAMLFSLAGTLGYWQFFAAASGGGGPLPPNGRGPVPPGEYIGKLGAVNGPDGGRDLFSYGHVPLPAPPVQRAEIKPYTGPGPEITVPPGGTPPPPVPPTPGPPPITIAYTGYARDNHNRVTAFLETSGANAPAGHYNLRETDFLVGRYRVNRITADAIEVEDLDRAETAPDRRRTIAITPPLAARK
jgi:hypothetical protein